MKTFKKTFRINTEPSDIYSAITNPYTIELWSGYPALMSTEPGSEFSLWEGDITGLNIEFVQDKKIVQEWFFEDEEGMPSEHKSIVTIKLHDEGSSTDVELLHINIPDEAFDNIVDGWDRYYFKPLKELVEE